MNPLCARDNSAAGLKSLFLWLVLCIGGRIATAEDRIIVQQANGARFPLSGIVDDFNGRELVLHTKGGTERRSYPRSEVIEVVTSHTARHEKGRQLLADGQAAEALVELNAALKEEDREWVRREILSQLVRCALWTGDYRTAGVRFLPIVDSDPDSFHFDVAPLAWCEVPLSMDLRQEARNWLGHKSAIAKLIGASHLLFDRAFGTEAEGHLRRLARDENVRIQRLAQMQLWRQRMQAGTSNLNELARWESTIEELPVELRGGGYFILGQAALKQREYDRAAAALLRLPLVHDADRHLASRACFQAAEALEEQGDKSQAINLYNEVMFRFGDTPWGPLAETKWNSLKDRRKTAPRSE